MTITSAITIDIITDNGTAISTGKKRRNSGTAINDSPKPNVDLTNDAIKLMMRIKIMVEVICWESVLEGRNFNGLLFIFLLQFVSQNGLVKSDGITSSICILYLSLPIR